MSERRNEILEEFRRQPLGKSGGRSKDMKARLQQLRSKDNYLTDTQTSDYTKSSAQINCKNQHLEETVRKLERQNQQLKQKVLELRTTQFFEVNQEKIKSYIKQNEKLKEEIAEVKKQLEQSLVERDFLERFNKNLKAQCESLAKEILILKSGQEGKKADRNIYTSRDEGEANRSGRNSSGQSFSSSKKKQFMLWKKQKEEVVISNGLRGSLSTSRLNEDYCMGKSTRHKGKTPY